MIKLVRSYQGDLEEFGLVRFEIRAREAGKHGGGDVEYAILNKHQAPPSPIVPFANASTNSGVLTMSSREIAKLTEKEHKNVLRDIRKTLEELDINGLSFERVYLDAKGEQRTEFLLPKDLTITLVSGYNVQVRHRIVTRWMELEEKARGPSARGGPLEWIDCIARSTGDSATRSAIQNNVFQWRPATSR